MAKKHDPKTGRFVRTTPDYKALYEALDEKYKTLLVDYRDSKADRDKWVGYCAEKDFRIEFLLDHCGPICKWLYRKHFGKEGGE